MRRPLACHNAAVLATLHPAGGGFGGSSGTFGGGGDDAARVREATDIVALIAEHVALRPKGREFVGLCPFHDDKNPSMYVVPAKQIFHCFVCGAGGDAFTFVRRHMGLEFREALELLAQRAGIELAPRRGPSSSERSGPSRGELCEANALAQRFFAALLAHEEHGRAGRETIERRGISTAMVEQFGLGVAPDRWDGLIRKAEQMKFDPAILRAAGLIKPRDDGSGYDTFRHRLMFPIYDPSGRVIAFGGRKLRDEDEPKYLNSPESAVFDKSSSLFGLRQASMGIRREKAAVIVEGYTDVIACHQAGLTNAVASLGTALTSGHARVLRRLCEKIVLVFDGDEAGQRAADRAVEVLFAESIDVCVVTLDRVSDAKDPDELLKREGGVELLRDAIENARDLLTFRYERLAAELRGSGPAAMDKAVREELATLARLGLSRVPRSRRELIMRQLQSITGLSDRALVEALPMGRRGREPEDGPWAGDSGADDRAAVLDVKAALASPAAVALACVLVEPRLRAGMDAESVALLDPAGGGLPQLRTIASMLLGEPDSDSSLAPRGLEGVLAALSEQADGAGRVGTDATSLAVLMHETVRTQTGGEPERVEALFRDCLTRLKQRRSALAGMAGAAGEATGGDDAAKALDRLRSARQRREALGDDMTRLPRPRMR